MQHQVVPERLPHQVADQGVVLVAVAWPGRQDQVRGDPASQLVEVALQLAPGFREAAVRERLDPHVTARRGPQDVVGGGPGLVVSRRRAGQHDPVHVQARVSRKQLEDRAAAADLDVVGVRTDAQQSVGAPGEVQGTHQDTRREATGAPKRFDQTSQGAAPDVYSRSSSSWSLKVSMPLQKPS